MRAPVLSDLMLRWGGKFHQDVMWNMSSFAISAAAGVLLNALIGATYGAGALGVFIQVFAVYTLFSQFSAMGIHFSVLQATAANVKDRGVCAAILLGAIPPTLVLSAAAAAAMWLAGDIIGMIVSNSKASAGGVSAGIAWATAGLFLFGVNKVLQGAINGQSWMKSFASLQVIRAMLMIGFFLVVWGANWPADRLPSVLTAAEIGVFLVGMTMLLRQRYFSGATGDIRSWIWEHLHFGVRSVGAAALTALNSWIDALMLGHFCGEVAVGVYGLPMMLAAGFYQVLVVLRNNYNPRLVQKYEAQDLAGMERMIQRGKRLTYMAMIGAGVLVVALYPLAASVLNHKGTFVEGWPILAILLGGVVLVSGYVPFSHILMLARRPGLQTWTIVLTVVLKVVLNLALIPFLAGIGAAIATAVSYVFNVALMIGLTRRLLKVRL